MVLHSSNTYFVWDERGIAKESGSLLSASRGEVTISSAGDGRTEQVPYFMAQLSIVTGAGMNVSIMETA